MIVSAVAIPIEKNYITWLRVGSQFAFKLFVSYLATCESVGPTAAFDWKARF